MKRQALLALTTLLVATACAPMRPLGPADSGVDARGACTRNEDCNDNTPCTRDLCLVGGVCENTADNAMCPMGQTCVSGRGCTSGMTRTCMTPADCDDRIPCTRDTCLVDGTCRNQPDDTMCTMGQRCDPMRGCGTSTGRCTMNSECNDMIDCTQDTCTVMGTCEHVPQNSRCTGGRTCNAMMGCVMASACRNNSECDDRVFCNGTETCTPELACVAGTPVNCADSDPCTIDECNESMRMCTRRMDPMCMGSMVRSGIYNVAMPVSYRCVEIFMGTPAIDLGIESFQFTVMGTNLTVLGRSPAGSMRFGTPSMTGTLMGMSFMVTGVRPGDCPETYTLRGTFTDADNFTGTLTLGLTGLTCMFTNCTNQSWPVTGRYRP
jgi:hypothetical protein